MCSSETPVKTHTGRRARGHRGSKALIKASEASSELSSLKKSGASSVSRPGDSDVTPTKKNSSLQPPFTPETEITLKVKDLIPLVHNLFIAGQAPGPSFDPKETPEPKITEASEESEEPDESEGSEESGESEDSEDSEESKESEESGESEAYEISKNSRAYRVSRSRRPGSSLGPTRRKVISQDEGTILARQLSTLSISLDEYTREVRNSWIPSNVNESIRFEILKVLEKDLELDPSYIYVFCEVSGSGFVDPTTGESLTDLEDSPATLPLFRRADGKTLSLKKALRDGFRNLHTDQRADKTSTRKRQERKLRIKIGRSGLLKNRMKVWGSKCGVDIMLLMVYDCESFIGPITNPTPTRHAKYRSPYDDSYVYRNPARYANTDPSNVPWDSVNETKGVPCGKLVELLIQKNLAKCNRPRYCNGEFCNVKHREWFEIPDTVEAIQKVDTIIQRWIAWGKDMKAYEHDRDVLDNYKKGLPSSRDLRAQAREARAEEKEARLRRKEARRRDREAPSE